MSIRILMVGLLSFLLIASAWADELAPEQERRLQRIEQEILSPFCPGRVLRDCPSSSASELKAKIREKIMAGESDQEITNFLESLYGKEIHALPSGSGIGLLAWLMPVAFLSLGLLTWLIWLIRNRAR